jgi:hypothetical protein
LYVWVTNSSTLCTSICKLPSRALAELILSWFMQT